MRIGRCFSVQCFEQPQFPEKPSAFFCAAQHFHSGRPLWSLEKRRQVEDPDFSGGVYSVSGLSTVNELGISIKEVAKRLEMSSPGMGFLVERGQAIGHENEYHLIG